MELKYSKIVDREKKKVELFVYGELGEDYQNGEINGHYLAQELNWLGKNYDEITVRINSNGGRVSHGLSIVSEMLQSPAYIIAKVDGVAASMAAVILAGADKVIMNDYARVMVHSPYYSDENGEEIKKLSENDKKALDNIKNQLIDLLKKRGIDESRVVEMMKTDSWFTAEQALSEKLIDEVIATGKKERASLDITKLVALVKKDNFNNERDMKGIIAKLNSLGAKLEENATDEQIVAAIDEFMKTPSTSSGTPESKETGKGLSKAVVDKLLAVGKKTGAVTDANEEAMRQLADEKPDLFASLIDPEKLGGASKGADDNLRISDLVKELRNQGPGAIAKKWDDLTDKERDDLYDSKPETYKAMYKEKFGVEYDKA